MRLLIFAVWNLLPFITDNVHEKCTVCFHIKLSLNNIYSVYKRARCSCVVECLLMLRWVMVNPLSHFTFQPVLHNWYNACLGTCYSVFGDGAYKRSLVAK